MKRNKALLILGTAVLLVLQTVFGAYAIEVQANWNKISPELFDYISKHPDETFDVVIWLDNDIEEHIDALDLFKSSQINYRHAKRQEIKRETEEFNIDFVDQYLDNNVKYISICAPVIYAEMTLDEIELVSNVQEVDYIYLNVPMSFNECAINVGTTVQYELADMSYGYTGEGVRIGIFELGYVDETAVQNIDISVFYKTKEYYNNVPSNHATNVCKILSCIAPDAIYYSAGPYGGGYFEEALDYLINEGNVDIINCSMAIPGNAGYYDRYAKMIDYYSYYYDVVFVTGSGNASDDEEEPECVTMALSYNSIVVGSISNKNTLDYSDDVLSWYSLFSRSDNVAYKPDIVAPGENIHINGVNLGCGTSYSAPIVSSAIALAMEANPDLKGNVPAVKALVSAGVSPMSPHRYTVSDNEYRQYGAGLLDINGMLCAVESIINDTITNQWTSKYEVITCNRSGSLMRVALSYLINSEGAGDTPEITNINIAIMDSNLCEISRATTNSTNMEIVEFIAPVQGNYYVFVYYGTDTSTAIDFAIAYQEICSNHFLLLTRYENELCHVRSCAYCAYAEHVEHNYLALQDGSYQCTGCNHIVHSIVMSATEEDAP